jgi:hypothetical protein
MSGQLVVTQRVGLGLLSLVALALLTTIAVSVLGIRDSRAFTGGQARAAAGAASRPVADANGPQRPASWPRRRPYAAGRLGEEMA